MRRRTASCSVGPDGQGVTRYGVRTRSAPVEMALPSPEPLRVRRQCGEIDVVAASDGSTGTTGTPELVQDGRRIPIATSASGRSPSSSTAVNPSGDLSVGTHLPECARPSSGGRRVRLDRLSDFPRSLGRPRRGGPQTSPGVRAVPIHTSAGRVCAELRHYFRGLMTDEVRAALEAETTEGGDLARDLFRRMGADGLARARLADGVRRAGARRRWSSSSSSTRCSAPAPRSRSSPSTPSASTLMRFGTDEQHGRVPARHPPRRDRASPSATPEPEAGTDLAAPAHRWPCATATNG